MEHVYTITDTFSHVPYLNCLKVCVQWGSVCWPIKIKPRKSQCSQRCMESIIA